MSFLMTLVRLCFPDWGAQELDASRLTTPGALRRVLLDRTSRNGEDFIIFLLRVRLAVSGLMMREALQAMEEIEEEMAFWKGQGRFEEARRKAAKLWRLWRALAVFVGRVKVLTDELGRVEEGGDTEKMKDLMVRLGTLSKNFGNGLCSATGVEVAENVMDAIQASMQAPEHSRGHGELRFWEIPAQLEVDRVIVKDLLLELNLLPVVCARIRSAIAPFARSWHFQRHWFKYSEATLALVVGGRYLVSRSRHFGGSGELEEWIAAASVSLRRFLEEHVYEPTVAIYRQIFQNTSPTSASKETLASARASLQRMIDDFAVSNYAHDEAFLSLAKQGNMLPVMKVYEEQMQHPIRNLVAGEMLRALLIQVQALKANVEELMTAANDQMRSNEINLQILALLPAALVTVAVIYGTSAMIRGFMRFRHNAYTSSIYERARICVHEISIALAQGFHSVEKGGHQGPESTGSVNCFEILGITIAKVRAMERLFSHRRLRLPKLSQQKLIEDLELLKSSTLSSAQKLRVLDAMYRAYPALR